MNPIPPNAPFHPAEHPHALPPHQPHAMAEAAGRHIVPPLAVGHGAPVPHPSTLLPPDLVQNVYPDARPAPQTYPAGSVPLPPPKSARTQAPGVHDPTPWLSEGSPAFDHMAALNQLATLETFDEAVKAARNLGGPTAGLRALMQTDLMVGAHTLRPCSISVFWFLQVIGSPLTQGGQTDVADLARALLAFTNPEQCLSYIHFVGDEVKPDMPRLNQAAMHLASQIRSADFPLLTQWIVGQLTGIEAMLPPAGEEAGNFQTAPGETNPPPATPAAPVPPDGSLS